MISFLIIYFICSYIFGQTCTSQATGNWNTPGTWAGGVVPTSSDNVVIADGYTVTIDASPTVNSLTVGQGSSGILKFDGTARTLTVTNNVTINSGGTFQHPTTNQNGHIVSIGGNLTNNGTLDFYSNANRAVTLKFTGSSNATFSGTGSTTDIHAITIDKGTSYSSVLEISPSNFSVKNSSTNGFLTLTNGMCKISGSFTISNKVFTNTSYTIGATTGFYLNNSNFTVTAQNGYADLYGKLQIDAGTFNIGTGLDDDLWINDASVFVINGGTLNVAESIFAYATSTYFYTQTGGNVVVCTGAVNPYAVGSFDLDSYANFTMSGGTIIIRNPSTYATASSAYDYYNAAGTRNITGGTVQFGDASTAGAKTFQISGGYFPNLTINNSGGNHTIKLSTLSSVVPTINYNVTLANNTTLDAGLTYSADAIIGGNISIGTGSTYTHGTSNHTIGGDFSNSGTYTTSTGTITFNGSSVQNVGGTSTTNFYNLTNSNSSTGIILTGNIGVSNTLSMSGTTANIDLNGNTINLSSTGSISGESNTDRIYGTSGSITTTRSLNAPSSLNVGGMGLILTSAANLGSTTITRQHTDLTNGDFSSLTRNYQISPTTNSGLNATITFNYFDNELNGLSGFESNFSLWRSTDGGSTWTQRNGTVTAASNFITLSAIDAFSLWGVGPSSGVVLNSKILDFNVTKKENKVALKWSVTNEQETEYYEVEASFDGIHFHPLSSVNAKKNHANLNSYFLCDENYVNGINYYRLKSIDYDGSEEYTKSISIDMTKNKLDLVMTVNSLGQKIDQNFSGVVFDIYSDGSSVKRIQ